MPVELVHCARSIQIERYRLQVIYMDSASGCSAADRSRPEPRGVVSCPDHTPAGERGLATQAAILVLPDVLKPVNCTCENANN